MDVFSGAPKAFKKHRAAPALGHVNVTFRKSAQLKRAAARYIKAGY